ncbi:MAG: HD domain-containing protein [Verrucomicrobiaceae bacterium]|nr:MAG: HD domain-containing protein [Verrucomicrobiaceae bacterium]
MTDHLRNLILDLQNGKELSSGGYDRFGPFTLDSYLGGGFQGEVFGGTSAIGRRFAIKLADHSKSSDGIYSPTNAPGATWWAEVAAMVKFQHRNIVRIYSAGTAIFDEKNGWILKEGPDLLNHGSRTPYIIMDFIPHSFSESTSTEDESSAKTPEANTNATRKTKFERVLIDISSAISACHSQKIAHSDISTTNIRFSAEDDSYILLDFGFSKHLNHRPQSQENSKKSRTAFENDISTFATLLIDILEKSQDQFEPWRFRGLSENLKKTITDPSHAPTIDDLLKTLSPFLDVSGWTLNIRRGQSMIPSDRTNFRWKSRVRIPLSGSVFLCKAVEAIIDTEPFQRLRKVKQLGPTSFVYPGATHTRFEHSLGVYHLACRYLEQLTKLQNFRRAHPDLDHAIRLTVAAALLHDIGHYPFSHWVEELGKYSVKLHLLSHEDRALEIIKKSEIADILRKQWDLNAEDVCDLIKNGKNSSYPILGSIISSRLDCDKVDYLMRDSHHCGVAYGNGIDLEHFIDTLHLNSKKDTICLNRKGRASLMGLTYCRNTMYKEVYWHKTVRCLMAMFKRAFYEFTRTGKSSSPKSINKLIDQGDEGFLNSLSSSLSSHSPQAAELLSTFRGGKRNPFKLICHYQSEDRRSGTDADKFFEKVMLCDSYEDLVILMNAFRYALNTSINLPPRIDRAKGETIGEFELLIETTPVKQDSALPSAPHESWIFDERSDEEIDSDAERQVITALNHYLPASRQAFIYVAQPHGAIVAKALYDKNIANSCFSIALVQHRKLSKK